jgi:hypothetical protein
MPKDAEGNTAARSGAQLDEQRISYQLPALAPSNQPSNQRSERAPARARK